MGARSGQPGDLGGSRGEVRPKSLADSDRGEPNGQHRAERQRRQPGPQRHPGSISTTQRGDRGEPGSIGVTAGGPRHGHSLADLEQSLRMRRKRFEDAA